MGFELIGERIFRTGPNVSQDVMNLGSKEVSIEIAVGTKEKHPGNYLKKVLIHAYVV